MGGDGDREAAASWLQERTRFSPEVGDGTIFAIAMPKKKEELQGQLQEAGLMGESSVMHAVQASRISHDELVRMGMLRASMRDKMAGPKGKPTEAAIHLSHLAVALHIVRNRPAGSRQFYVVFEDDLAFPRGLERGGAEVRKAQKAAAAHFRAGEPTLCFLGFCFESGPQEKTRGGFITMERPLCTHAYMMNHAAATRVVEELLMDQRMPVDHGLVSLQSRGVKLVGVETPVVNQQWGGGCFPAFTNSCSPKGGERNPRAAAKGPRLRAQAVTNPSSWSSGVWIGVVVVLALVMGLATRWFFLRHVERRQ